MTVSVHSAMTEIFEVWLRDTEADTWKIVRPLLKGSLTQLTPDGARREQGAGVTEPVVSHIIRMGAEARANVLGGRRLRDIATKQEYVVRVPRWQAKPRPGNLKVPVAAVPEATQD